MLLSLISLISFNLLYSAFCCTFPPAKNTTIVYDSITIAAGTTADFQNARLVGSGLGPCDVTSSGIRKPILHLHDGATVKNVIIGKKNGQGVSCAGSCTLQNVFWEVVCFHAADFTCAEEPCSSSKYYTYKVIGGAARASQDKLFTQAGPGQTLIDGFCSEGGLGTAPGGNGGNGKAWCSCGSCDPFFKRSVTIQNSKFSGKGLALASVNTFMGDSLRFKNIVVTKSGPNTILYAYEEYATKESSRAGTKPKDRKTFAQVAPNEITVTSST